MYGLILPVDLVSKFNIIRPGIIVQAVLVLGFGLSIKLATGLDFIQGHSLIYTGVLCNSFTGRHELDENINLIYQPQATISYNNFDTLFFDIHTAPHSKLLTDHLLYLPKYSVIAKNVMRYLNTEITAQALMACYGITDYSLIKYKQIMPWQHASISDIMSNLKLIWPGMDQHLFLSTQDKLLLLNYNTP